MRTKEIMSVLCILCAVLLFASCDKPFEHEQKDWENTTAYFNASDEAGSNTYYKP